jgi:hypothetical protein
LLTSSFLVEIIISQEKKKEIGISGVKNQNHKRCEAQHKCNGGINIFVQFREYSLTITSCEITQQTSKTLSSHIYNPTSKRGDEDITNNLKSIRRIDTDFKQRPRCVWGKHDTSKYWWVAMVVLERRERELS